MENKQNIVNTPVKTYIKWDNKDKSKSKKFSISLFNQNMVFKITSATADGKLDNSVKADAAVYISSLAFDETPLLSMCDVMLKRIKRAAAGESLASEAIIFHNGKTMGYKGATQIVSFDVYTKEQDGAKRTVTAIKIRTKEKSESTDWPIKADMYLSDSLVDGMYVTSKELATEFKENYAFFNSLKKILEGFANRSAMKRDIHWTQFLGGTEEKAATDNKKSYQKSTSVKSLDEDDDMPF